MRVLGWAAVLYALQVNGLLESQLTDLAMGEANSTMIAARQVLSQVLFCMRLTAFFDGSARMKSFLYSSGLIRWDIPTQLHPQLLCKILEEQSEK